MNAHRGCVMLFILVLLGLVGCGLKEYEERMEQERKRAKIFDQKENLLDEPLEVPSADNKPVWDTPVYLRVPHGCKSAPAKKDFSFEGHDARAELTLYRFPFVLDKPKDDQEKTGWNLFVGRSDSVIRSKGALARAALSALNKYFDAQFKDGVTFDEPNLTEYPLVSDSGAKLEFGKMEFETSNDLWVELFTYQYDNRHLVLVFMAPKSGAPSISGARDACLKTLDISDEADQKRGIFLSTHKPRK